MGTGFFIVSPLLLVSTPSLQIDSFSRVTSLDSSDSKFLPHSSKMVGETAAGASPCCFQCLQRCIETDFSAAVVFRYGICDSALPFGSAAVVQVRQRFLIFPLFSFAWILVSSWSKDSIFLIAVWD